MRLRENGLKVIEERDRAKNARKAAKEAEIASDQAFIDKITEKKGIAKRCGTLLVGTIFDGIYNSMGKKHPLLSRQDELDKKREHIGEILHKEREMKAAAE